jgi:hypothetical protein
MIYLDTRHPGEEAMRAVTTFNPLFVFETRIVSFAQVYRVAFRCRDTS